MNRTHSSQSSSASAWWPKTQSTTAVLRGSADCRTASNRACPGVPTTATSVPSGAVHSPYSRPTVVVGLRCLPPMMEAAVLVASVSTTSDWVTARTAVVLPTPNGPMNEICWPCVEPNTGCIMFPPGRRAHI